MNSAIERLLSLRVKDIMTSRIVSIPPEETMTNAAALLRRKRVSGMPVIDHSGRCLGILSCSDFVRHLGSSFEHVDEQEVLASPIGAATATEQPVSDLMSPLVHATTPEATLIDAARLLCSEHIHRLPVLDGDQRVVGWISSLDIVAAMIHAVEE